MIIDHMCCFLLLGCPYITFKDYLPDQEKMEVVDMVGIPVS